MEPTTTTLAESSPNQTTQSAQATPLDDRLHWYKDAIIYELHIKAFSDGNGDGIGDFQGLLEKLDYLQELGVTAIWVLPFYPSPLRDDGYDIADYYSINPSYGTIEQFKQFLDEAHKRGLRVITELVINHTSDQHPWFQRARSAPKDSPERAYYVWTDDPNQYKDVRIIFQDFEASNWTWDPVAQQYYWHRFFHHQPDLNYDNPEVQAEIFKIIDYWCAMGVDGFRLDAVPYLYEREGTNGENLPETHAFLKKLRRHIDEKFPGTLFLAEANMWPEDSASYFGNGDECHMNYHFPVMPRMFMALKMEDRYPITDIFDQTPPIPETCQWALFLRNHDELTLEMVTDEERDYMYRVYVKDPKARINLGIRHRLAPLMDNNRRKIELLNALLFSLPGTPVVYYGDEIGMGDNFYLGDRDGVRTPMQWSPDRNAGFSSCNPHQLYLPVIMDPEYHYESINVETQRRNTSSLFWFMKRLINMRKRSRAFSRGDMHFIHVDNPKVLAFTRTYQDETLLIIVNLSKYSQPAEIDLSAYKGHKLVEAFSKNRFPDLREDAPYFFTLAPHSFHWFQLQRAHPDIAEQATLPMLALRSWDDLLGNSVREELETNILPSYLPTTKWFLGKERRLYSVSIAASTPLPLPDHSASLLFLEVAYESGLPEYYHLSVLFAEDAAAERMTNTAPGAIIAYLAIGPTQGALCDALFVPEFQQWLMDNMAASVSLPVRNSTLRFRPTPELLQKIQEGADTRPRLHLDATHTALSFGNAFYLKMYRKVDRGINPSVEIAQVLSQDLRFEYVPRLLGTIELQIGKENVVLGAMQELVENHGDGYSYIMERTNNYFERIMARTPEELSEFVRTANFSAPADYEALPEITRELIGVRAAEQAHALGMRTGQLHLALASAAHLRDFAPEPFSLHYQRSLFSSLLSQVRETYQSLTRNKDRLPEELRPAAEEMFANRDKLINRLKRIYSKKLNVVKTRIHGNYHLKQILLTGKDIAIKDFGGNPHRPYSERRLKRSVMRDVASMIRSFYYVAYEGLHSNTQLSQEQIPYLLPFVQLWAYYVSGFFTKAYLEMVKDSALVPAATDDLEVMMDTYLLEVALASLNYELNHRPHWAAVPLHIIQCIMNDRQKA